MPQPDTLLAAYTAVRQRTLALAQPLSEEDCCVQSMPDASPAKWHMAHTTWFFETFILERLEPEFRPHHPAYRVLFNSYYNGVGEKYPRPQRGLLSRPSLAEILDYRQKVDERMRRLLARQAVPPSLSALLEIGLQHEQQHQELLLTDVKHLLSMNPMSPAYAVMPLAAAVSPSPLEWRTYEAGVVEIGHAGVAFGFDNERPRHRQFVEAFALASRLTTNGEYREFVENGGYANPALWLSEGWDWVQANRLSQPLYWQHSDDWQEFTLHGLQRLDPHRPVTHISFFEADAYARWRGARLPTEAEWERAASMETPNFGQDALHPSAAQGEERLLQLFGACWQWTLSSYTPYPGYRTAEGALGEYNGKFMVNQYVLRGSSCATPPGHARLTYRNFFPTGARWQFSGIRLAQSR